MYQPLIDEVVEIKNRAIISMRDKYPRLLKLTLRFWRNKSYGIQILDRKKRVSEEYSLVTDSIPISARQGISDGCLTLRIEKSFLERILLKFKEDDNVKHHPILTSLKLLPEYFSSFVRGDIRYKRFHGSRK